MNDTQQMALVAARVTTSESYVFAASTMDYDLFVFDPTNRPIDAKKVEKLKRSIQKHNLLSSYPIVIASVDGQWIVRDGQHRLTAARLLGVPIFYTFNDAMTVTDVRGTNGTQSGWTTADFFHSFCVSGHMEYLKLRDFWARYPWMSLNCAIDLCHYGDRAQMNKDFVDGEYRCNDLDFAETVASATQQFSRWAKFYKESLFITAVSHLFEHENYNHARMMRKMEYMSARLVKCNRLDDYLAMFTAIYNNQQKKADVIEFKRMYSGSSWRKAERRNKRIKHSESTQL